MVSTVLANVGPLKGELRLLPDLMDFLCATRRLRPGALLVEELAWHGRRVDLATLTSSGVISAYELKLGNFGRVLEQATYNRLSFDRSWIVVGETPNESNLALAVRHHIGVIVVIDRVRIVVPAPLYRCEAALRRRLIGKIRALGSHHV